jgi:copper homeostasis protein
MSKAILEVCAFSVESCIIAEQAGAVRVELCDNPVEGGTTPSYGAIHLAREKIGIKLYPILRPRSGNYFYDENEFEVLKRDILMCKSLGCDGISIGVQTATGEIDVLRLTELVHLAYPMGVTCNRAFDGTPDPIQALEDVISCGCERILTSGQASSVEGGYELLARLVKIAGDRIVIMPGAGVRSSNISMLIKETGAKEYHTSARVEVANPMAFVNKNILDYGGVYIADFNELRSIMEQFD